MSRARDSLNLRELWDYRELLYFLTWRDVKVRYKQTLLGAGWAVLQPLLMTGIVTLFFARLVKIPSPGIPYPLFVYAALVPWNFFANSLSHSVNSLVGSSDLIKKVYFPRLFIPISSIVSEGIDFLIAFVVLLGMTFYFKMTPAGNMIWLVFFSLLALLTTLGMGLWLSALNVKYRDVRHITPFLIQFWFFATPLIYSSSELRTPWRTFYGLNPMVGVIEGFRWTLLGGPSPEPGSIILSTMAALVFLASGLFYFRRTEETFADVV